MTIMNMNKLRIPYCRQEPKIMIINELTCMIAARPFALIVHIQYTMPLLILISSWMQGHRTHTNDN